MTFAPPVAGIRFKKSLKFAATRPSRFGREELLAGDVSASGASGASGRTERGCGLRPSKEIVGGVSSSSCSAKSTASRLKGCGGGVGGSSSGAAAPGGATDTGTARLGKGSAFFAATKRENSSWNFARLALRSNLGSDPTEAWPPDTSAGSPCHIRDWP